jgi:phospholipid-translocating ATPase
MGKEAYDDYCRYLRDREANSSKYSVLSPPSSSSHASSNIPFPMSALKSVPSSALRVGDLLLLEKNQRVPADMVLLRTSDTSGTCFIRTDQLDGETDWKLRVAVPATQTLKSDEALLSLEGEVYGQSLSPLSPPLHDPTPMLRIVFFDSVHFPSAVELTITLLADSPIKDIHTFIGTFTINTPASLSTQPFRPTRTPSRSSNSRQSQSEDARDEDVPLMPVPQISPLTAENVLWANTVLAAGSAIGFVIYTGTETRAVMNTSHPKTKVGLLDMEINRLAKVKLFPFFDRQQHRTDELT